MLDHEDKKREQILKSIQKMYENYGMDFSILTEEELDRLINSYLRGLSSIEKDLKYSKQFSGKFKDDII